MVVSTVLSMNASSPVTTALPAPGGRASTLSLALALSRLISFNWLSGSENVTYSGLIWLITTSAVSLALTLPPGNASTAPAMPFIGALMVV